MPLAELLLEQLEVRQVKENLESQDLKYGPVRQARRWAGRNTGW